MRDIDVVVTGVGPVSAIGCGRNEFWEALVGGQHGFAPRHRLLALQAPAPRTVCVAGESAQDAPEPGPQGLAVVRPAGQRRELGLLNQILGLMLVPHQAPRESPQEIGVLDQVGSGEGVGSGLHRLQSHHGAGIELTWNPFSW